jgi:PAS domain S-box-containing protein
MSTQEPEGKATILIVEDDATMAQMIKRLLEQEDHSAVIAQNGTEALRMLGLSEPAVPESSTLPDLILLDILLPGPDGFEVCTRIRQDARLDDVPVIMVTALGSLADTVKGLECGADDYIAKPFKSAELLARVRAMLRIKRLHDERKQAEEALRESEEELRTIFDGVGDGLALIDVTGKVVRINRRIAEVGGYTEEEIVGKRFELLRMFPPSSLAKMLSKFAALVSGQQVPPFEVEVYTKAGERLSVELRGSLLRQKGKIVGLIGVMRDITERKRAEEALRRASVSRPLVGQMLRDLQAAGDLSVAAMFRAGQELAARIEVEALPEFLAAFADMGLGTLTLVEADEERQRWTFGGDGLVEIREQSGQPTCNYARGFLCGAVDRVVGGTRVAGVEVACQSMGG